MTTLKKHSVRLSFLAYVLLSSVFIFIGCSSNNAPPANEVFIKGMAFTPSTLTVKVGTSVKWTNKDGITHTVTSDTAGQFDSGNVAANGVFSFMFMTVGTYNYHCSIHPTMKATIVVIANVPATGY